ncbi:MAG: bacillithiol biosynthesis deacetylase BshB1 [Planctomycetaceae bacterium]|nr:bacillithiol biosynthesis deacetylase BshB1 [Planctomycetaceae bacterium]
MLDLLVVATHPDDAEISVGGILAKAVEEGLQVGILDLTTGEPTPHGTEEIRQKETSWASLVLGVQWRENLALPNRKLEASLDARRAIANVFRRVRPRLILAPYHEDAHPDHIRASQLCVDARFWAKLSRTDLEGEPYWPPHMMNYFSVHLRIHPAASIVVDISGQIEKKMESIRCYESQMSVGRSEHFPTVMDDIRDRARYWGWSIHAEYGEPLFCSEQIAARRVDQLLA